MSLSDLRLSNDMNSNEMIGGVKRYVFLLTHWTLLTIYVTVYLVQVLS